MRARASRRPPAPVGLGRLPYSFAIAGVQKSGTTTLAAALDEHPLVARAPVKEIHFFDDEERDWLAPLGDAYTAPRRAAIHEFVGDATPSYLYWPRAVERMAQHAPDMRLVAIFRDPLERLFSHWTMQRHRYERWPDWPTFLRKALTELTDDIPADLNAKQYYRRSGVIRGLYGAQLTRALGFFEREQWLLLEFRSLLADWDATLDRVTDHVGLPRFDERPALRNSFRGADAVVGTAPTAEDLTGLARRYEADLETFAELSGIDTSAWPTVRLLTGELSADELAAKFAQRVTPPA